jgi:hypothetical protein
MYGVHFDKCLATFWVIFSRTHLVALIVLKVWCKFLRHGSSMARYA